MQLANIISWLFFAFGIKRAQKDGSNQDEKNAEIAPEELDKKLSEGWQQGTLFSVESSKALIGSSLKNEECLIIATQTCDLLHRSLESEPTVELLTAEIINVPVPKSAGKSFRMYELALEGIDERHLRIKVRPRIEIDKQKVFRQAQKNELQLDPRNRRWFSRWLGERYLRPAFPNAFVDKLAKQKDKIAKTVSNLESCRGMYLILSSWDELAETEKYSVAILLLMSHDVSNVEQQAAETALVRICDLMTKAGHEVDDDETKVVLDNEISVYHFNRFRKWSLDYISLRNPQHAEPTTAD